MGAVIAQYFSKRILKYFSEEDLLKLARETKFVQRKCRKITPSEFFYLCLFSNVNSKEITLKSLSTTFEDTLFL